MLIFAKENKQSTKYYETKGFIHNVADMGRY